MGTREGALFLLCRSKYFAEAAPLDATEALKSLGLCKRQFMDFRAALPPLSRDTPWKIGEKGSISDETFQLKDKPHLFSRLREAPPEVAYAYWG